MGEVKWMFIAGQTDLTISLEDCMSWTIVKRKGVCVALSCSEPEISLTDMFVQLFRRGSNFVYKSSNKFLTLYGNWPV